MTPAAPPSQPAVNPQITQLLAQLEGPALPEPISLWPPAIGWWLLASLIIALITTAIISGRHWYKQRQYRAVALQKLKQLTNTINDADFAAACTALLKQTFITAVPRARNRIAGLYGKQWLEFLHTTGSLSKLPFEQQQALASICGDTKYQPNPTFNRRDIERACGYWIAHHKPAADPLPALNQRQEAH